MSGFSVVRGFRYVVQAPGCLYVFRCVDKCMFWVYMFICMFYCGFDVPLSIFGLVFMCSVGYVFGTS